MFFISPSSELRSPSPVKGEGYDVVSCDAVNPKSIAMLCLAFGWRLQARLSLLVVRFAF